MRSIVSTPLYNNQKYSELDLGTALQLLALRPQPNGEAALPRASSANSENIDSSQGGLNPRPPFFSREEKIATGFGYFRARVWRLESTRHLLKALASERGIVNARPRLLEKVARATVGVHSQVPDTHVSAAIGLGTDRRGTGTLVSSDGLILTVHYMLLGAQSVIVTLVNGDQFPARIIAKDYRPGWAC